MACFKPRTAWLPLDDRYAPNGRPVFREPVASGFQEIYLPCRKCEGCVLDSARDYGVRASHEAKMHKENCFITLTYDPAHMPFRGMLKRSDLKEFMQKLRNSYRGKVLRIMAVGEYGSRNWRPHFHICLFGHWFVDSVPNGNSASGFPAYKSKECSDLWGKGLVMINEMGVEVAMYAAQYALKKVGAVDGYERIDSRTGEAYVLPPEFRSVSKQLGCSWLDKYALDVFPHDYVVMQNKTKVPVPQYYLRVLREWCEDDFQALKAKRVEKASEDVSRMANGLQNRLDVRRVVLLARRNAQSARRLL